MLFISSKSDERRPRYQSGTLIRHLPVFYPYRVWFLILLTSRLYLAGFVVLLVLTV